MATIRQFEDILAWQKSRELARRVFEITHSGGFSKDFVLKDQIWRAAVSVSSNIAEGFERGGNREFIQFLSHAKGSCGEVRSQLHLALDAGYLSSETWEESHTLCLEISRLLDGFSAYLRKTDQKGRKFTNPAPNQANLEH